MRMRSSQKVQRLFFVRGNERFCGDGGRGNLSVFVRLFCYPLVTACARDHVVDLAAEGPGGLPSRVRFPVRRSPLLQRQTSQ